MKHLTLNPAHAIPPTRDAPRDHPQASELPPAKEVKVQQPQSGGGTEAGDNNAGLMFVGTATTILWVFESFVFPFVHVCGGVVGGVVCVQCSFWWGEWLAVKGFCCCFLGGGFER